MHSLQHQKYRDRLVRHLKGGQAFTPIDKLVENVAFDQLGSIPGGLPYSMYQLFYHIRYAQYDILEYCRTEKYHPPEWPEDYWPKEKAPASEQEWEDLVLAYFDEREEFCEMIKDESNNLLEPFSQNADHNLFRQAELIIEHTAYHTGQLFVIWRLLNK